MAFERALLDLIEEPTAASPLHFAFLRGISHFMQVGVALRHFAYDQKWLRTTRLPIPVLSVGSVLSGGSGKTPFVHFLAQQLAQRRRVAIISRGYRSAAERKKEPHIVLSTDTAEVCGDEPLLLARKMPHVEVIVGRDRIASTCLAQSRGAEIVLLDDGMQHRRLYRDLDIALLPADDLLGKGFFLPRGLLRDTPRRLREVDLIAIIGAENEEHFLAHKKRVALYSTAPVVGLNYHVKNGKSISGKRVAALCAIARPQRFLRTLKELDCEVVYHQFLPDHRSFPKFKEFEREAFRKGAELLVCTEKDWVKLGTGCVAVEMELNPQFETETLHQFILEYL